MVRRLPRAWVAVDASIDDHPKLAALGCWAAEAFKQLIIISKKSGLRGHLSPHSRTGAAICLSMRKPLGLFVCEGDPTLRTAGMRYWSLEGLYEKGVADLLAAGHLQGCLCSQGCVSIRDWDEWQRDPERAERAREWREEEGQPNAANENERSERKRTRRTKTNKRSPSPSPSVDRGSSALEISTPPTAASAAGLPASHGPVRSPSPTAEPLPPPATSAPASSLSPAPSHAPARLVPPPSPTPTAPTTAPTSKASAQRAWIQDRVAVYDAAYRQRHRETPDPDPVGRSGVGRIGAEWRRRGYTTADLDNAIRAYVADNNRWYSEKKHALRHFGKWLAEGRRAKAPIAKPPATAPPQGFARCAGTEHEPPHVVYHDDLDAAGLCATHRPSVVRDDLAARRFNGLVADAVRGPAAADAPHRRIVERIQALGPERVAEFWQRVARDGGDTQEATMRVGERMLAEAGK